MFRSSTNIRELALNLAKVIFILQNSVKLHRYLLCGCVAACHGVEYVLHAVQNATLVAFCTLNYKIIPTSHSKILLHNSFINILLPLIHNITHFNI